MKPQKQIVPPKWATWLLNWYCRPEILEDLEGDLHEYFERNVKEKGSRRAKLIYILDVLKFLRFYIIRKPEFINLLINWIMLGSYIKTSGRNLVRNKLFSAINIIGLSISMSVGLLMISILADTLSYDKFNEHHSNIYRVITRYEYLQKKDDHYMATTSLKVARSMQQDFSMPRAVAVFRRDFEGDFKFDDKTIPLSGFWANEDLFKVFSFSLIKGNPDLALKEPFSVVLTEKAAVKLFGTDEVIGKTITLKDKSYTITGLMKDVPRFSHIQFEVLGSLSTREIMMREDKEEMAWDNVWSTWVYLLLPDGADTKALKSSLDDLSVREDPSVKHTHIELALQPMDEIMFSEDMGNQIGPVLGRSAYMVFGGLAFIVILSACFNYTNLSIARSLKRTREVGVRKVIGALKNHVVGQFIVEAVVISLLSLAAALLLFMLMRPYFLSLEADLQKILSLELSPTLLFVFFIFAVFTGACAGFFPALFFSRINAAQVLKDLSSVRVFKKLTMRKALIVFQYCISIIFISSTLVMYRQYRHFVAFDLGFRTENILNIKLQGNKPGILKKELMELPEVKSVAQSSMVTSVGNYWGTQMKYALNPLDSGGVYYNKVDENYIPLLDIKLLSGRNFTPKSDSAKETEVIVNEQVLNRFNIAGKDPQKALDEIVKVDGKDMRIIGVMRDFHYGRANDRNQQREVLLRYNPSEAEIMSVKLTSDDLLATYSKIQAIWKKLDNVHPMDAKFYDEQIEQAFSGLKVAVQMAGFLAILTISIASMGLLGMVVFTTETRLKEISIRKVLGASEGSLLYLLSKSFLVLLGIATVISLPLTVFFFQEIAFPELANHAPLAVSDLAFGVLAILLLALLMIVSQTLKVARTNPAEVLKTE